MLGERRILVPATNEFVELVRLQLSEFKQIRWSTKNYAIPKSCHAFFMEFLYEREITTWLT